MLLIIVYFEILSNLGSKCKSFRNLVGDNFLDYWHLFSNILTFQGATFEFFASTIWTSLVTIELIVNRLIASNFIAPILTLTNGPYYTGTFLDCTENSFVGLKS